MGARADKWLAEEVTMHFMAPQYSRRIYFLFLRSEFVLLLLEEQQFVGSLFFMKVSLCFILKLISCEALSIQTEVWLNRPSLHT